MNKTIDVNGEVFEVKETVNGLYISNEYGEYPVIKTQKKLMEFDLYEATDNYNCVIQLVIKDGNLKPVAIYK